VVDHLKEVYGKKFDAKKPAINVGTKKVPIYYPRVYLRIMPYQDYKRLLPANLVNKMLGKKRQCMYSITADGSSKLRV
jgi:eukaryotic translation initiation factor 2C